MITRWQCPVSKETVEGLTIPEIHLTAEQNMVNTTIFKYVREKRRGIIRLQAPGGCGKSQTMAVLAQVAKMKYLVPSLFLAPTHKALSVLKREVGVFLEENPLTDDGHNAAYTKFLTLASALGKKPEWDATKGRTNFRSNLDKCHRRNEFWIIIIDESSMVKVNEINPIINNHPNSLIILCGDSYQLDPIAHNKKDAKEKSCLHLPSRNFLEDLVLTYNFRAKNSPELSKDLTNIRSGQIRFNTPYNRLSKAEALDAYIDLIENQVPSVMLCLTNKKVDTYSRLIRSRLYGHKGEVPILIEGDRLTTSNGWANLQVQSVDEPKENDMGIILCEFIALDLDATEDELLDEERQLFPHEYLPRVFLDEDPENLKNAMELRGKLLSKFKKDYKAKVEECLDKTGNAFSNEKEMTEFLTSYGKDVKSLIYSGLPNAQIIKEYPNIDDGKLTLLRATMKGQSDLNKSVMEYKNYIQRKTGLNFDSDKPLYKSSLVMTVHKSQGSTYDTVFFNQSHTSNYLKVDYNKLFYTAISRAKRQAFTF